MQVSRLPGATCRMAEASCMIQPRFQAVQGDLYNDIKVHRDLTPTSSSSPGSRLSMFSTKRFLSNWGFQFNQNG
jgi:hypothetical protein